MFWRGARSTRADSGSNLCLSTSAFLIQQLIKNKQSKDKIMKFWKSRKFILSFTIVLLICLAWMNRFMQDDALISFRYAENFANGNGLVWNQGERVEGYTNFLWTLIISIPIYLGLDPTVSSFIIGITLFLFSLILSYRISWLIFRSESISLLSIILLGTNYTFSSYATGGLETQLQTCLFLTVLYIVLGSIHANKWKIPAIILLSISSAGAMLTRLDSAVLLVTTLTVAFTSILKQKALISEKLIKASALVIPFLVLVGGWLIWKQSYYGDILPNTFYVKVSSGTSIKWGIQYVYKFLVSYWLVPFVFMMIFTFKKIFERLKVLDFLIIFSSIILWLMYIIKVGGDFMEFRFIVPILPLCFILVSWIIIGFVKQRSLQIALISLVIVGSFQHSKFFETVVRSQGIDSIQVLQKLLNAPSNNWEGIGRNLKQTLPENSDVSIAVTPAGAIPYYSGLTSIDMYGLNDKWVARNGKFLGNRPGHQKGATFDYLMSRRVNLVIAHPNMINNQKLSDEKFINTFTDEYINSRYFFETMNDNSVISSESKMIIIPIDEDFNLIAIYLFQNPDIDKLIQNGTWKVFPILRN